MGTSPSCLLYDGQYDGMTGIGTVMRPKDRLNFQDTR